jgi:hypothetical protein
MINTRMSASIVRLVANRVTTLWLIVAFGDEGAELRFNPLFSPDMSEDASVSSARMA